MLGESDLSKTSTQLQDFRLANTKQQETLSGILEKYGTLIEDYKRLKSDYEEERDARERYKQMARGQERNPFVLVLVDGDGYIFDDDLISNGAEGGQRAAHLLNDAVKTSMRMRGLENCRIMVRVYTNLVGLSKAVSKAKLCGPEMRSLAAFAANFTRSNELFDFVDAGELKENADSKIRALFRQFVDNTQCRNIYFAGCHDVGYINELIPHRNNREKITLVRNHATHPEFTKLGMRLEDFPGVFRSMPLDSSNIHSPTHKAPFQSTKIPPTTGTTEQPKSKPCYFYQKGLCKYGDSCINLHAKSYPANGSSVSQDLASTSWRAVAPDSKFSSTKDIDFMRNSGLLPSAPSAQGEMAGLDFAALLPLTGSIPQGNVALNAKGERLDAYIPPITADDRIRFTKRVANKKICNKFHLTGHCLSFSSGNACDFDHSPIDDGMRNYLRSIAASTPCARRSTCRSLTCLNGHVCQKADCKFRGGRAFCKLPGNLHLVHLGVDSYAPGSMPVQPNQSNGTNLHGYADSRSTTPPPPPHEENEHDMSFKSPGVNVGRSLFGINRGLSHDKSINTPDSDDDDLAGKAGASLNLPVIDSDLD